MLSPGCAGMPQLWQLTGFPQVTAGCFCAGAATPLPTLSCSHQLRTLHNPCMIVKITTTQPLLSLTKTAPCTSQHTYCACACAVVSVQVVRTNLPAGRHCCNISCLLKLFLAHQQLNCGPNLAGRQQQGQQLTGWCLTSFAECICLAVHELAPVRV